MGSINLDSLDIFKDSLFQNTRKQFFNMLKRLSTLVVDCKLCIGFYLDWIPSFEAFDCVITYHLIILLINYYRNDVLKYVIRKLE